MTPLLPLLAILLARDGLIKKKNVVLILMHQGRCTGLLDIWQCDWALHFALLSASTLRSVLGVPQTHLSCPNTHHF